MKRADVRRSGFFLFLIVGLVVGAAVAACSASGKKGGSPFGTGTGGTTVVLPDGAVVITNTGGTTLFNNGGAGSGSGGAGSGTGGLGSSTSGACPAPIDRCSAADAAKFANATPGPKLLYPYDKTVFPRGLGSPTFQWDTGTADAVMIELKSSKFSYRECFGAQSGMNIKVPQDGWDAQSVCAGGDTDPVTATVTIVSGGQVHSVSAQLFFAFATIKGAIYYNTYISSGSNGCGAVEKITPGAATNPTTFLSDPTGIYPTGPCFSCHSLSARGNVMAANHHTYGFTPKYESWSFDVANGTPTPKFQNLPEAGFAGIYPDGTVLMTNGPAKASVSGWFPQASGQPVAVIGPATSRLLDTATGSVITAPGWDVSHANMPMFSPDGKHMVYNDQDISGSHTLWVVDFDLATKTFSNKHQVFSDGTRYPGWPFFTPDSKQIIFALGTRDDFASQIPDLNLPTIAPNSVVGRSHLMILDLASGTATPLASANGFNGTTSYLPNKDNDLEFYPTMSPVAAGGYYWAFFTSRRTYGNLATQTPFSATTDASGNINGGYAYDPKSKKIWATAISIGVPAGTDASHPAFYLEGQDLASGNMRAFAALDPCKEDGATCTAGSDCCSGYCNGIDPATGVGICGPLPVGRTCALSAEKCTQDSDCCTGPTNGANGATLYCLGGYCAEIIN